MNFSLNKGLAPMAIEKIKIPGAVLELPANLQCQLSPFGQFSGQVTGLDWQCCFAVSSKRAPEF
jgi:hypothetical protein